MKLFRKCILAVFVCTQLFAQDNTTRQEDKVLDIDTLTLRTQHFKTRNTLAFSTPRPILVTTAADSKWLNPGQWHITLAEATPAPTQHHVYVKSFQPHEADQLPSFLENLRTDGFTPIVHTIGKRFHIRGDQLIDNRTRWIAAATVTDTAEAEYLKKQFNAKGMWAWVRTETLQPGEGFLEITDESGTRVARLQAPATLHAVQPIQFSSIDQGYLEKRVGTAHAVGPFTITVGPQADIEVVATHTIADYLKEVLPAEMPALWPPEALKAQAVAARSEIFASLAGKHRLEGFDFCTREHCRAWKGFDIRTPATNAAVDATAGEVLLVEADNAAPTRIATTVYASNCGGTTENNDNVWAGPPNPSLRGIIDRPNPQAPNTEAYCAHDEKYFRWTRTFSQRELSKIINKHHEIGTLQKITPGDRGISGRLKSLHLIGDKTTATVHRELAIRRALGALPSAAFTIKTQKNENGETQFLFSGSGRGHGVGLCQQGAKGMALHDIAYYDILRHYFSGVTIGKLR